MSHRHRKHDNHEARGSRSKSGTSKTTSDSAPLKRYSTDRYNAGKGRKGEEWYLEYVPGYNLKWEKLRDWLKTQFKGQRLKLDDQADKDEIDKLREPVYDESEVSYESDPPLSDEGS